MVSRRAGLSATAGHSCLYQACVRLLNLAYIVYLDEQSCPRQRLYCCTAKTDQNDSIFVHFRSLQHQNCVSITKASTSGPTTGALPSDHSHPTNGLSSPRPPASVALECFIAPELWMLK